jgi:formylglycine-generating enzyme required for sulfatase activity
VLTLRLADVRNDGEPTRRRANRSEFSSEEWQLVSELADYPNRLLVTVTTPTGETYAEVAHEAIFRRWHKLREWIVAEREFLAWRSGLEASRRAWQMAPEKERQALNWRTGPDAVRRVWAPTPSSKDDALLMGAALTQAKSWFAKRSADLSSSDRQFIELSIERETKVQARARRVRALVYLLLAGMIAVLIGWINQSYIEDRWRWYSTSRPFVASNIWPYVLEQSAERALKPKDSFRECAPNVCPELVVIPAGKFTMGSPSNEHGHLPAEEPQHEVVFAKSFAVSKFAVTWEEWDICVQYGDCDPNIPDSDFGKGNKQPLIMVTWQDAQRYTTWLAKMTGKPYRLLSEAEYEYVARAGTQTAYWWGDKIGRGNANCDSCGSEWDRQRPAPVGSFAPNSFGLYDTSGNVWEFLQDCLHNDYRGAPTDGSAWVEGGDCSKRVVRGGSWSDYPVRVRSASRGYYFANVRESDLGFRIARSLP